MKLIKEQGLYILLPEEGYLLNQDEIYSEIVYLAVNDSPSNWKEVRREEVILNE